MRQLIALACGLCTSLAFAICSYAKEGKNSLEIPKLTSLRAKNGINPAPYDEFWKKWELVTVRYREDNGEQRFIYANDIAFKAMRDGEEEFPDGAAFGKVAFQTKGDPQFPNSKEPIDFTRLQLMVKDSQKFSKLDGWSYWLHVDGSVDNSAEDSNNAVACHACHTIVRDRDYIFAMPTFTDGPTDWSRKPGMEFKKLFRTRKVADLRPFEKEVLNLLEKKPRQLKSFRMRLFSGSLYESIGPLSKFAQDDNVYFLVDHKKKRFLIAEPKGSSAECKNLVHVYMDRRVLSKKKDQVVADSAIRKGIVCDGKNKWVKNIPAPEWLH